jgi:hypothetical protein
LTGWGEPLFPVLALYVSCTAEPASPGRELRMSTSDGIDDGSMPYARNSDGVAT